MTANYGFVPSVSRFGRPKILDFRFSQRGARYLLGCNYDLRRCVRATIASSLMQLFEAGILTKMTEEEYEKLGDKLHNQGPVLPEQPPIKSNGEEGGSGEWEGDAGAEAEGEGGGDWDEYVQYYEEEQQDYNRQDYNGDGEYYYQEVGMSAPPPTPSPPPLAS